MATKIKNKISNPSQEDLLEVKPGVLNSALKRKFYFSPYFIIAVAAALAVLIAVFFAWQNRNLTKNLSSLQNKLNSQNSQEGADKSSQEANKQTIDAVGKLIILPQDEQPSVATVVDPSKLQGQPFFAQAKAGDTVLIYSNAKKAILYRSSENRIIELAPLSVGTATSTPQTSPLTLEIRNGSGVNGAAGVWKQKLADKTQFLVTKTGNAANGDYQQNIIVDLTNSSNSDLISQLQQFAGATVVKTLPTGEAKSSADLILIIGRQ